MAAYLFLIVVTVAAVSVVPLKSEADTEGWIVPSIDGSFHGQSKKQFEDEFIQIEPRAVSVQYYLYTKSNPNSPEQLFLNDANALSSSNFNNGHPTRFIIHDWQNNYQSPVNTVVRDALMQSGIYNVICVDWSSSAETLNYYNAMNAVPTVGKDVAIFIDFLNSNGGMLFNTSTLIGYGHGAHVSGFAGKQVTGGVVRSITGLDPALPLFVSSNCTTRLCFTDATFVDVIHSNAGFAGSVDSIGNVDFYINGGISQPGCGLSVSCAHSRSYIYYGESLVKNNFPSIKCPNYQAALANNCGSSLSNVKMGSPVTYGNGGVFYVPVNSQSPYGTG